MNEKSTTITSHSHCKNVEMVLLLSPGTILFLVTNYILFLFSEALFTNLSGETDNQTDNNLFL